MRRPTLASIMAAIVVLAAPAALRAQQDIVPAEQPDSARAGRPALPGALRRDSLPPVDILQVRRACLNKDAPATLQRICAPPTDLSLDLIKLEGTWRSWGAPFRDTTYNVADSIRTYAGSLDTEKVTIREIFGILGASEQWRILTGLGGGSFVRAARALPDSLREALVRNILSPTPVGPEQVAKVMRKTQENLTAAGLGAPTLTEIFDAAVADTSLTDSLRLEFVSQIQAARDTFVRGVLGKSTVGKLTKLLPPSDLRQAVIRAAEAPFTASRTQPAASGARLSQSSLVWGTTDFVVDRVQQQFQLFALEGFAGRLCRGAGEHVLRHSCGMIHSNSFGMSRPGVTLLRGAVSRDLEALPYTSLDYAYTEYGHLLAPQRRDALQVALRVTDFALQTARGADPLLALASVADSFRVVAVDTRERNDARAALLGEIVARLGTENTRAARDSLQLLRQELKQLRDSAEAVVGRAAHAVVRAESSRVGSVLVGLAALYATRFDPMRMHSMEWELSDARDLLRYQAIAMAANYQPRVRRAADRLAFEPWNLLPVALSVDDDLQRLRASKLKLDSLRATQPDSSGRVRQARVELVRGSFGFVDQVLFHTSQVWTAEAPQVQRARRVSLGVQEVVFPMMEGNYATGLLALNGQVLGFLDSVPNLDARTRAGFTRGVTFVSELADASSADQVNAALVRLTDSGEGFTGKRRGESWHVTLNAFGGAYGGFETAEGETAVFGGLYLPVGVEFTAPGDLGRPFGWKLGTGGLFIQALDLGALASWRLSGDDDVEQRPEVGLAQVFSPGAFLVWNVAGAPVTVGYGLSWAPELREIKDDADEDEDGTRVTAWRHGLFIGFDIPLFP